MRRSFSNVTLQEAMQLLGQERIHRWEIDAPPLMPSDILQSVLQRLEYFDQVGSEAARLSVIDALLLEIVPRHRLLKVWKGVALATETLYGVPDYLIAPNRAYLNTPLLCAVEAKKDDFAEGQSQCLAEMAACREKNAAADLFYPIYGIVTNGQQWDFYRVATAGEVSQSPPYSIGSLPQLLGMLDYVCGLCAANVVKEI